MHRKFQRCIAVASVLGFLVAPAAAHDHAAGVVKERMNIMEAMAKQMKAIRTYIRNGGDLAAARSEAQALRALAAQTIAAFRVNSMQPPTDARPEIWKNWADFEARAKAAEVASESLAATDVNDAAAMSSRVRAISESCSGCHERYRLKR